MSTSGSTPEHESSTPCEPVGEPTAFEVTASSSVPDEADRLSAAAPDQDDRADLWLRRGDQLFVGLLVVALLGLLGIHWVRLSRWGSAPVELSSQRPREYYYSLDINSATWIEWTQLDGIGETLARRIIADREERGPFRNPADVSRVKGIGPKLLEKILPYLQGGTEAR